MPRDPKSRLRRARAQARETICALKSLQDLILKKPRVGLNTLAKLNRAGRACQGVIDYFNDCLKHPEKLQTTDEELLEGVRDLSKLKATAECKSREFHRFQ